MIKIPALTDADVDALVDYVIYLSWRGELERRIIDDAIYELDLAGGDRILNTELATRLAANPELSQQLDAVLEETDGEQLSQYEDYLEFESRLSANPNLKSRLEAASGDDESLADDLEIFESYQGTCRGISRRSRVGRNLGRRVESDFGRRTKRI